MKQLSGSLVKPSYLLSHSHPNLGKQDVIDLKFEPI